MRVERQIYDDVTMYCFLEKEDIFKRMSKLHRIPAETMINGKYSSVNVLDKGWWWFYFTDPEEELHFLLEYGNLFEGTNTLRVTSNFFQETS